MRWPGLAAFGALVAIESSAFAQAAPDAGPITSPAGSAMESVLRTARSLARRGQCDIVESMGAHVRTLDPSYFLDVFVRDPDVARCDFATAVVIRHAAVVGDEPAVSSEPVKPPSPKSANVALGLSLVPTVAGFSLVLAGLGTWAHAGTLSNSRSQAGTTLALGEALAFIGPSIGHIYAGKLASRGLAWRGIGAGVATCGLSLALSWTLLNWNSSDTSTPTALIATFAVAGAAIAGVGAVYDVVDAPRAARRYNHEHGLDATVTVAPLATRAGIAPAIGLLGQF